MSVRHAGCRRRALRCGLLCQSKASLGRRAHRLRGASSEAQPVQPEVVNAQCAGNCGHTLIARPPCASAYVAECGSTAARRMPQPRRRRGRRTSNPRRPLQAPPEPTASGAAGGRARARSRGCAGITTSGRPPSLHGRPVPDVAGCTCTTVAVPHRVSARAGRIAPQQSALACDPLRWPEGVQDHIRNLQWLPRQPHDEHPRRLR